MIWLFALGPRVFLGLFLLAVAWKMVKEWRRRDAIS